MVEGAHLDLLDLVSNCHEAGREPGISKDLSTSDTTVKLYPQKLSEGDGAQLHTFLFLCGENLQKPKHERTVDASN